MGSARDSGQHPFPVSPRAGSPLGSGIEPPSFQTELNVSPMTVWAHRLSMVILVLFCIELGMLLTILPWTSVWTENSLLTSYPSLRAALRNEFARGAISGLGLVDIWIGIWEAIRYSDPGKSRS
jgi:hypothetical protein